MSARELAALIQSRQISARDVMQVHLDRIARINPRVNAIVSKLPDETRLALADDADTRLARGDASARCTACRSPSRTTSR